MKEYPKKYLRRMFGGSPDSTGFLDIQWATMVTWDNETFLSHYKLNSKLVLRCIDKGKRLIIDSKGQEKREHCAKIDLFTEMSRLNFRFALSLKIVYNMTRKRVKEKYLKKNVTISNIKLPGVRCGPARQSQLCAWSKSSSHGPWGYFKVS